MKKEIWSSKDTPYSVILILIFKYTKKKIKRLKMANFPNKIN